MSVKRIVGIILIIMLIFGNIYLVQAVPECGDSQNGKHKFLSATCTTPKKCALCGETSGSALGHQYLYGRLNEKQHTVRCYRCKKENNPESHKFNSNNKCEKCGWTKPDTACKEHKYMQVEYSAPTCQKEGYKVSTCTVCKMIKTENYNKTAHDYNDATCTVAKKCKKCGAISGKPLGHAYQEASCTQPRVCSRCHLKSDEVLGHQYVYGMLNEKKHTVRCYRCNEEKKSEAHNFNENNKCEKCGWTKPESSCKEHKYMQVEYSAPTCQKEGYKTSVCMECKIIETETYKKTKHVYEDATCFVAKKCLKCGVTTGKPLKHEYVYEKLDKENHLKYCKNCKQEKTKEEHKTNIFGVCSECKYNVRKCEHLKTEKVTVIESNCYVNGKENIVCVDCEKIVETKTLLAKHRYMFLTTKPATCFKEGVKEQYCVICGEMGEEMPLVLQKKPHDYDKTGKCTLCGNEDVTKAICEFPKDKHLDYKITYQKLKDKHIKIEYCLVCKKTFKTEGKHNFIDNFTCECGIVQSTTSCECGSTKIKEVYSKAENERFHDIKFICQSCNKLLGVKENQEHSIKNGECPCGIKVSINISGPKEAYVGETISLVASVNYNGSSGNNLVWTSSGIENKMTVAQNSNSVWLRSQKTGNISVKVKFEYESGKYVTAIHSVKIIKTNQSTLKEKIVLIKGTVTNFGGNVLKKISGESVTVLGTSIKAEKLGTSIIEDSTGVRYEVVVVEKEIGIISATINIADSIYIGEEASYTVRVNPSLTTSEYKVVASDAISLTGDGKVKGVKKGNGTLKVICNNKTLAQVEIKVKEEKVSVTKDKNTSLIVGGDDIIQVPILLDVSEQTRNELEISYICESPYVEIDANGNIKIKENVDLAERQKVRVDVVVKRGEKIIYDSRGKRNSEVTSVYVYPKEKVVESVENGRVIEKGNAKFYESEEIETGKNTIIYCGGAGQRMDVEGAMEHIKDQPALEDWNQYALTMLYPENPDKQPVEDWEAPANDMIKYVEEQIKSGKMDPNNIYIDGMSNGGYGAYYLAKELEGRTVVTNTGEEVKISVKKLTLIDGAIDYKIGEDEVRELLENGVEVQIYACSQRKSEYAVSKNSRKLIDKFKGTEGFTGIKLTTGHSATGMIEEVYNERGLHENDN